MKKIILLAVTLCAALSACKGMHSTSDYVKDSLRDPDSLVIESETKYLKPNGDTYICGDFRAKNGMGGYTKGHYIVQVLGTNSDAYRPQVYGYGEDQLYGAMAYKFCNTLDN